MRYAIEKREYTITWNGNMNEKSKAILNFMLLLKGEKEGKKGKKKLVRKNIIIISECENFIVELI